MAYVRATQGFPQKMSAHSVQPFGQLWLTYKQIYISEGLYIYRFMYVPIVYNTYQPRSIKYKGEGIRNIIQKSGQLLIHVTIGTTIGCIYAALVD